MWGRDPLTGGGLRSESVTLALRPGEADTGGSHWSQEVMELWFPGWGQEGAPYRALGGPPRPAPLTLLLSPGQMLLSRGPWGWQLPSEMEDRVRRGLGGRSPPLYVSPIKSFKSPSAPRLCIQMPRGAGGGELSPPPGLSPSAVGDPGMYVSHRFQGRPPLSSRHQSREGTAHLV